LVPRVLTNAAADAAAEVFKKPRRVKPVLLIVTFLSCRL